MTLLDRAAAQARRYLDGLAERRVAPDATALAALAELDEPLPEAGSHDEHVLDLLDRVGSPATVASAGGRYFGFVTGGALPVTVAANWLATAWDQNAGPRACGPGVAAIEEVALRWTAELLGLPAHAAGALTTGATMANLTALAAARHRLLRAQGWDVEADGLFGAPPLQVVVGEEVHASVRKALAVLGLGQARVTTVPADGQGRLRPELLPAFDRPTVVCAQAGNVNTGACDPLGAIADAIAAGPDPTQVWLHIDGAFGLWAAAAPSLAPLVAGADRADSWATDAHKWLNTPYDCGVAFVRRSEDLVGAFAQGAAYLVGGPGRDLMHATPEMSRRARGVEVWAAIKALGRSGVADLVTRCCAHARRFAGALAAAGHEVRNDVVLNQVLARFGDDDATTLRVVQRVQDGGACWAGSTVWQGRASMRISVSSWATTDADVDASIAAILDAARDA